MSNEELVARIRSGIDKAENMLALYENNKGMIHKLAVKYSGMAEIEDLEQEGFIGLCNAVDGYQENEGAFATYAFLWIRQTMINFIDRSGCIQIPHGQSGNIRKYKKAVMEFTTITGREPGEDELRRLLGMSWREYNTLKQALAVSSCKSLDGEIKDDAEESYTLYDLLSSGESPEEVVCSRLEVEELKKALWDTVEELPADQAEMIRLRFKENLDIKECSRRAGVKNAAPTIRKGLNSLRKPQMTNKIIPYIPDYYLPGAYVGGVQSFKNTWTSSTEKTAIKLMEDGF